MLCPSFFRIVMLFIDCTIQVGTQFCSGGQCSDLCRATYPVLCAETQHVGRGDLELSRQCFGVILLPAIPAYGHQLNFPCKSQTFACCQGSEKDLLATTGEFAESTWTIMELGEAIWLYTAAIE